jgi:dienelactone hydrolase
VAHVRRDPFRSAAALMLLSLATAGCAAGTADDRGTQAAAAWRAPPPGFTTDTFSREGLVRGASATEAGCRALADGLWVGAGDGRRECLRYAVAGTERGSAPRTALVHIPGDAAGVAFRVAGGRPQVEGTGEGYEVSAETRRAAAAALSGVMGGTPVVLIGRPGMHGSSGDHARDRHTRAEVELVDAALTALRRRHGFRDLVLSGFSSGGAIAANLLARRTDIRCAVIASAPLDLAAFYRGWDGTLPDHYAMRREDLADPMRAIRAIRTDTTVYVLGDRRDRTVPAFAWDAWAAAARHAGVRVVTAAVSGFDPAEPDGAGSYHRTSAPALQVAQACAAGEPALAPHGPLPDGGAEIRTALAGPLLRAVE